MANVLELLIEARDQASQVVENVESNATQAAEAIEQHWAKVTAATAVAGAALEGLARKVAPLNEQTRRLAASLELTDDEVRELALSLSNVTLPLSDVLDLMELGRQRGIKSAEGLEEYVQYWDLVGDATGENATKLAEAGIALKAVGIAAGEEQQALASFGYISRETTGSVSEFLMFLDRTGPELREMGMDISDATAIMGVLEHELGASARTGRMEFRQAVREADGSLDKLLRTLGTTPEVMDEYAEAVAQSSGVIKEQSDIHAESYTVMQKIQNALQNLAYEYGEVIEVMSAMAPILFMTGPALRGVAGGIRLVTRASWGLLGPIGLLVAAGAGLALLITRLQGVKSELAPVENASENVAKHFSNWADAIDDVNTEMKDQISSLEGIEDTFDDVIAESDKYIDKLKDITLETGLWELSTKELLTEFQALAKLLGGLPGDIGELEEKVESARKEFDKIAKLYEPAIEDQERLGRKAIQASQRIVSAERQKREAIEESAEIMAVSTDDAIENLGLQDAAWDNYLVSLRDMWYRQGQMTRDEIEEQIASLDQLRDQYQRQRIALAENEAFLAQFGIRLEDVTALVDEHREAYGETKEAYEEAQKSLEELILRKAEAGETIEDMVGRIEVQMGAPWERLWAEAQRTYAGFVQKIRALSADLEEVNREEYETTAEYYAAIAEVYKEHEDVLREVEGVARSLYQNYMAWREQNKQAEEEWQERKKELKKEELEDLIEKLAEGAITQEEYDKRRRKMEEDFTEYMKRQGGERADALEEAQEKYEEAYTTIGEVIQETVAKALRALAEEAAVRALVNMALSIASGARALTRAAAGDVAGAAALGASAVEHLAAAGAWTGVALGAGAAASHVEGLQEGAEIVRPAYRLVGEGPYDEAVMPLSPQLFDRMAESIVRRMPQEQGSYAPTINFYSPRPLTATEARRQTEKALRQQALQWEGR